jgi:Uncharacterised protein family (UPF0158)
MENAVSLNELVNALQSTDVASVVYVDKTKGTIVSSVEDGGERDRGAVSGTPLELQRLERCPVPSEREEREVARRFCNSVEDADDRRRLVVALSGAAGLDAFLNTLFRCGIAHDWFRVRDQHLIQFAKGWLEARDIPYVNDVDSGGD